MEMIKNDITYEYRKFVNRANLSMSHLEIGECTYDVLMKELKKPWFKPRFYHTTDTNQFFYDWNGKRYELNWLGKSSNIDSSVVDSLKKSIDSIKKSLNDKANASALKDKADKSELDKKADKSVLDKKQDALTEKQLENIEALDAIVENLEGIGGAVDAATEAAGKAIEAAKDLEDALADVENKYQPKGDYALSSEIPSLEGYLTEEFASTTYQPIGDYALKSDITDHVDAYTKAESDEKYALKSDITSHVDAYTKAESDEKYQEKGDYLTKHQSLEGYVTFDDLKDIYATVDEPSDEPDAPTKLSISYGKMTLSVEDGEIVDKEPEEGAEEVVATKGPASAEDVDELIKALRDKIADLESREPSDPEEPTDGSKIRLSGNIENPFLTGTYNVDIDDITLNGTGWVGDPINDEVINAIGGANITGCVFDTEFIGQENPSSGARLSVNVPVGYTVYVMYHDTVSSHSWLPYTLSVGPEIEGRITYSKSGEKLSSSSPIELKILIVKD